MKKIMMTLFIFAPFFTAIAKPLNVVKKDNDVRSIYTIEKMIKIIQPSLKKSSVCRIAKYLSKISKNYKVDPKLMIAIIDTESNFINSKVSITGDISLAQINTKVWDVEFNRLGLHKLNSKLLVKDENYALEEMAIILTIIKNRHAKTDQVWFARYHSHNKKFKDIYSLKIKKRMKMLAYVD